MNETDSPLAALTVLKKTCDHPALLSEGAAESVLLGGSRCDAHAVVVDLVIVWTRVVISSPVAHD